MRQCRPGWDGSLAGAAAPVCLGAKRASRWKCYDDGMWPRTRGKMTGVRARVEARRPNKGSAWKRDGAHAWKMQF